MKNAGAGENENLRATLEETIRAYKTGDPMLVFEAKNRFYDVLVDGAGANPCRPCWRFCMRASRGGARLGCATRNARQRAREKASPACALCSRQSRTAMPLKPTFERARRPRTPPRKGDAAIDGGVGPSVRGNVSRRVSRQSAGCYTTTTMGTLVNDGATMLIWNAQRTSKACT